MGFIFGVEGVLVLTWSGQRVQLFEASTPLGQMRMTGMTAERENRGNEERVALEENDVSKRHISDKMTKTHA